MEVKALHFKCVRMWVTVVLFVVALVSILLAFIMMSWLLNTGMEAGYVIGIVSLFLTLVVVSLSYAYEKIVYK